MQVVDPGQNWPVSDPTPPKNISVSGSGSEEKLGTNPDFT